MPIEDQIYILSLLQELFWLLRESPRGVSINIDATASTFQCWGTQISISSYEAQRALNLTTNCQVDTYTWIIDKYKELNFDYVESLGDLARCINRKYLKQSIMTYNYNATEWGSTNSFVDAVREDYPELVEARRSELNQLYKTFHAFMHKELFTLLYSQTAES